MRFAIICFLILAILTVATLGFVFVNEGKAVQTDVGLLVVKLAFSFNSIEDVEDNIEKLSTVCNDEVAMYFNMRSLSTRCKLYDYFMSDKSEVRIVWDSPGLVVFCIYADGFVRTDLFCMEYEQSHGKVAKVSVSKLDSWRDGAEGGFF